MNLDLDLLRTFVAVADLNTFAAAANWLGKSFLPVTGVISS